jgi:16S rRNA (uracil1498-N3)-methyltransferase
MIQFFAPDIESTLCLPEADSGHAVRVLRMQPGDELQVVDGRGHRFLCRLLDNHSKHAAIEIVEREDIAPVWQNNITVMVAPTKNNDRMEWLVEKLVETGINRIVPVRCARSERKEIKRERLEKIAVSAMKQSLKATLPEITKMMPIAEALRSFDAPQKYMGYCDDNVERKLFAKQYQPNVDVIILIGPEGDFSPAEVQAAISAKYVPVTMGDNRLRTETAALVACDTCHIINQINS